MLVAILALGCCALLFAPGDTFRIARLELETSEAVERITQALAAWAVCALVALLVYRPGAVAPRWWKHLHYAVALGISLPILRVVLDSISAWGVRLDAPVVLYPARLVWQHGWVPYRDIIDFNQPGSYVVYGLIDWLAPDDLGLRIVDAATCTLAALCARRAFGLPGWSVALLGGALFAVSHLEDTGVDCVQREVFVLALSMATGALLAQHRFVAAGAVFLLCFWMKFHSVLLVLPFLWELMRAGRPPWKGLATSLAVLIVGSLGVVIALAASGALPRWLEIVLEYLPLYGRGAGGLNFSVTRDLVWYRRLHLFLSPTAHPAIVGLALLPILFTARGMRTTLGRDPTRAVVAYYLCSLGYVLIQGTFWHYHSIPALFGLAMMISLAIRQPRNFVESLGRIAVAAAVGWHCFGPRAWATIDLTRSGRNDAAVVMGRQLYMELPAGETVQPLDIVQGVVDGMRRSDSPMATSFLYDFYLYHDVSTPIIQRWRARFLREMAERRPYFVIESAPGSRIRPYGADTQEDWEELDTYLREHYLIHREESGFRWWRRRD